MSIQSSKRNVSAIPPVEHTHLKINTPKESAGGLPAIFSSIQHVRDEIGLLDGVKILSRMNQKGGFDCPGCAWPDPDKHRSGLGEFCENGAKAIAEEATKKRVTPEFFKTYSVEGLSKKSDYWLGKAGRLTEPMILKKGSLHYEPISWDEAFTLIGNELNGLSSPHEAVFYTSGRTSNEAAFMYQLFAKAFGTNNLPDCSNMCHESSGVALKETLGIGKGSVTLEDLHKADVILVIGQNPGTNHPRMMSALKKCKENGGKIVHINPLPEAGTHIFVDPQSPLSILTNGTQLADHFMQIKINGDTALMKCIMKRMLEEEEKHPGTVFDHTFIQTKTEGFSELIADLKSADIHSLATETGLELEQIKTVAELLIKKEKIIACWAMGLTQHRNGVSTIQEVVNLLLLRGSIGKEGAGTCPVRGHSNVQGDRTMGIHEKPAEPFLAALDTHFGIISPREHGYDVVESIHAMHANKVKVFIGMGGNFISATPDSAFTGNAMQNCKLTVQISTKLNRSHVVTGETAIILPCRARTEIDEQASGRQFVSVENSMGVVHSSEGKWPPASGQLKSEPDIVAGIARATLGENNPIHWHEMIDDYDVIRTHIASCISGFERYNDRVRIPEGFYLPNGPRNRNFETPSGKAQFTVNRLPEHKLKKDEFILMTIRTHDQYNTTIYGLDDRYRGIRNERRVVLMNQEDMKSQGFHSKEKVDIISRYHDGERVAESFYVVPYPIAKGCVATYFPETNCLIPIHQTAEKSNTPVSKFVKVVFRKK